MLLKEWKQRKYKRERETEKQNEWKWMQSWSESTIESGMKWNQIINSSRNSHTKGMLKIEKWTIHRDNKSCVECKQTK